MAISGGGVFIAGLGGLGGHLLEHMLRLDPAFIRAADGDVFDESNLDRQLLSAPSLLGRCKAELAAERARLVAPGLNFEAVPEFLTEENCGRMLSGCAVALDGLDNVRSRLVLEAGCARLGIALVHGAIGGPYLEAGTVPPGSRMLSRLYPGGKEPKKLPGLSPTAAVCAGIQAAEAEKLLKGEKPPLWGRLLIANLDTMEFNATVFVRD